MFTLATQFLSFVFLCGRMDEAVSEYVVFKNSKVCTDGYFQCANDTLCVEQGKICNSVEDCKDGSDERNCEDVHDNNYFDQMVRKNPSAEHDDDDQNCALSFNGTGCLCRSRGLYCRNLNLDVAPDIPDEEIDILDFTGNNFTSLSSRTLETLPNTVKKLILKHCNIKEVLSGTFYKTYTLSQIYLDNNQLKVFPSDLFNPENALRDLIVSYNEIEIIEENAFVNLKYLIELDLRGNKITDINLRAFEPLKSLSTLYLQNNLIKYVLSGSFPRMSFLTTLWLTENRIKLIEAEAFENLDYLMSLHLSDNRLTELRNGTFLNLDKLQSLSLNDNFIKSMELGVFTDVPNLTSLKLENNKFRILDKKLLQPLNKLENIYFDSFEMCTAATHVRNCFPKGDGISSQDHLLDNIILRSCVWIMGAIGCTGNLIVLLGRLLGPSNNIVHSLYLRNLAFSDLLMGVYLFTIASVDQEYRGHYLRHQYKWRHSFLCNICGFLSTLSCESSVLILSLVTWDRFISVTQPLARKQPSPRTAALTLLVLWMAAALVALAPLSNFASSYFGDEFYGSNGVCLSLHIHEPYAMGWEYSATMFILVNAFALVFISYAYVRMINEIKASGVACRSTRQSEERDKVAQRFGIIVLTDSLCWVPIIIVKLVALFGVAIPPDLYAWLAIFVLPINSALNPILYTLTTTVFKKQVRKYQDFFLIFLYICIHILV
ncbi:unnamed protein product [Brassicogethes aeneus]|uniref:G-protein coupled receptors family 1 profile domain-containing protein n=1 Tax=Brassicogethes aeneus TaxID=1431903 RepID=A0A9P0FKZ7_BRAAE|nr:unnamed protein product [Brassicogethes aeneus]